MSLIVGTAGHIDHGKSSLVLALTGTDPDRLKEEKARGITIDLGFAHWSSGDARIAFVDVPGHERFVRNMLAGVGGIDAVLLVVAADESVMPQTREHFEICRLLGITRGVVALTKRDLVDEETLQLARLEVDDLLEGTPLSGAPVIPVSARTGAGLDALREALRRLALNAIPRSSAGAVRLPIDRAFTIRGFGTVVTGTLVSGHLAVDDELALVPGTRTVKVRGVQVHGSRRDGANAGERVAVNVGGVEVGEVERGQTLIAPGTLEPTRLVDVRIELLATARPLAHGTRVRFHQGTAELLGRVSLVPNAAGAVEPLAPGSHGFARIRLERAALLTRGDRFILRAYSPSVTIAGGVVLDPQAPRGGVRTATATARFEALVPARDEAGEDRALAVMAAERGPAGLAPRALVSRGGASPARAAETARRLIERGLVEESGGVLFAPGTAARLGAALEQLVRQHHAAHPLSEGIPREEARDRLFRHAAPGLFERVLGDLTARGAVSGRDRLASGGHRLTLSPVETAARDAIETALEEGGLKPPEPAAVAAAAGVPAEVADRMLAWLVRQRTVVKLDAVYFHQSALERLKADVRALKGQPAAVRLDVATIKDRYGISRKYAIPLLEYLDRERVTRRMGEARVVL
jgi:selenocysteine-specific elongation factor